jgi:hypothetical protein
VKQEAHNSSLSPDVRTQVVYALSSALQIVAAVGGADGAATADGATVGGVVGGDVGYEQSKPSHTPSVRQFTSASCSSWHAAQSGHAVAAAHVYSCIWSHAATVLGVNESRQFKQSERSEPVRVKHARNSSISELHLSVEEGGVVGNDGAVGKGTAVGLGNGRRLVGYGVGAVGLGVGLAVGIGDGAGAVGKGVGAVGFGVGLDSGAVVSGTVGAGGGGCVDCKHPLKQSGPLRHFSYDSMVPPQKPQTSPHSLIWLQMRAVSSSHVVSLVTESW